MKVKICGLMAKEHVDTAVEAGADYLGFVFAPSKRKITSEKVVEITKNVPEKVKKVGVFVAPTVAEVETTIQQAGLDIVQIHGGKLDHIYSVPVIRAFSVGQEVNIQLLQKITTDFLLLDAPPKRYVGGNGEVFDWEKIDTAQFDREKLIIAGGLTVKNVQQAKRYFHPYAVDVSSGVETDGVKDHQKIRAFVKKAKEEFDV